jgi:DNA invertase Pin-like site-specific DNA recombinase
MLSVIAQFELELRAERQREGIAKAKRVGVRFGRTKQLSLAQAETLRAQRAAGVTLAALMRQ